MKCLLINGSPHKGNTWTLVEIIKEQMEKTANGNMEFEEVMLADLDLPLCIGCYNCIMHGEHTCPHYKIVSAVAKQIADSDAVVFATSAYSLNVSAITKNFIDHMSYNFHRPSFFKKKMLAVSTAAGGGHKFCAKYIRDVLMHWGFNRGYRLPIASYSAKGYQPTDKVVQKCRQVADRFCSDILSEKYRSPSLKRIMYFNAWRGLSLIGKKEENADYRYWQESGMINRPFSEEIKVGWFRRFVGNRFFAMVKKGI